MAKKIILTQTTREGAFTRVFQGDTWAEKHTDAKYQELSRRLRVTYQQAASDLYAKQMEFLEKHRKRAERYRAEVEAGLLSENDYKAWMRGQIFQQRAWELKRGQLARLMVDADRQAMTMLNDGRLEVFADNADHMLFQIEKRMGVNTPFGLYNRDAVTRLIRDRPNLLPMPDIDEEKDYAWHNQVMQNAVTQGILQGETLDEIALRVAEETGEKALNTLRRNARTAYTGAMNAGDLVSMEKAKSIGIRIQKRWVATLDDKTRDSHARLDGQVRDLDKPFDSLLGPIDFPGDPDAAPANVWNCRCYMDEYFPDYANTRYRWDMSADYVGDVSYEEWRKMKTGG